MPTIHQARSWKITMYFFDHNPPHFHVISAGEECQIRIDDLTILAGAVPTKALNAARKWAAGNKKLLAEKWLALHED